MLPAVTSPPDPPEPAPVWVLADPRPGTAAQALGIAERLVVPFRVLPLAWGPLARMPIPWPSLLGLTPAARRGLREAALAGPWARMAPYLPHVTPRIVPDWPRLAVSAGRRSAPVSRWLRARGVRTVHCMRPGLGVGDFDLLVVGAHDRPRPADNLVTILGATHRLSPERLAAARAEWAELASLPQPRVALLLGGPVRGEGMQPAEAARLVPTLLRRFPGASILATTSRRTGAAAAAALAASLDGVPHRLFRWGEAGPNPYAGLLAWADAVAVTGDSVSMLSEACATGAPVLVLARAGGRHGGLADALVAAGRASLPDAAGEVAPAPPLDESGRVAAIIRAKGWLDGVGDG